jgi:hypothetical protein
MDLANLSSAEVLAYADESADCARAAALELAQRLNEAKHALARALSPELRASEQSAKLRALRAKWAPSAQPNQPLNGESNEL